MPSSSKQRSKDEEEEEEKPQQKKKRGGGAPRRFSVPGWLAAKGLSRVGQRSLYDPGPQRTHRGQRAVFAFTAAAASAGLRARLLSLLRRGGGNQLQQQLLRESDTLGLCAQQSATQHASWREPQALSIVRLNADAPYEAWEVVGCATLDPSADTLSSASISEECIAATAAAAASSSSLSSQHQHQHPHPPQAVRELFAAAAEVVAKSVVDAAATAAAASTVVLPMLQMAKKPMPAISEDTDEEAAAIGDPTQAPPPPPPAKKKRKRKGSSGASNAALFWEERFGASADTAAADAVIDAVMKKSMLQSTASSSSLSSPHPKSGEAEEFRSWVAEHGGARVARRVFVGFVEFFRSPQVAAEEEEEEEETVARIDWDAAKEMCGHVWFRPAATSADDERLSAGQWMVRVSEAPWFAERGVATLCMRLHCGTLRRFRFGRHAPGDATIVVVGQSAFGDAQVASVRRLGVDVHIGETARAAGVCADAQFFYLLPDASLALLLDASSSSSSSPPPSKAAAPCILEAAALTVEGIMELCNAKALADEAASSSTESPAHSAEAWRPVKLDPDCSEDASIMDTAN